MGVERGHYISYLLRLWEIKAEGETVWRASLENPLTHERRGFGNLADLFAFLEKETERATHPIVSGSDAASNRDPSRQTPTRKGQRIT